MPIDYGDVTEAESEHPSVLPHVAAEADLGTGRKIEGTCSASAAAGG